LFDQELFYEGGRKGAIRANVKQGTIELEHTTKKDCAKREEEGQKKSCQGGRSRCSWYTASSPRYDKHGVVEGSSNVTVPVEEPLISEVNLKREAATVRKSQERQRADGARRAKVARDAQIYTYSRNDIHHPKITKQKKDQTE